MAQASYLQSRPLEFKFPLSSLVNLDREREKLWRAWAGGRRRSAAAEIEAQIEQQERLAAQNRIEAERLAGIAARLANRETFVVQREAAVFRRERVVAARAKARPAKPPPVVVAKLHPSPAPAPSPPVPAREKIMVASRIVAPARMRDCPDCVWFGPAEDYRAHRHDDHG